MEKKNAISRKLLSDLENCLKALDGLSPAECRVVVFRSATNSDCFCAGADLKERKDMTEEEARGFVRRLRATFTSIESLEMPTIAAIDGVALGGGMELALSCDLRYSGISIALSPDPFSFPP